MERLTSRCVVHSLHRVRAPRCARAPWCTSPCSQLRGRVEVELILAGVLAQVRVGRPGVILDAAATAGAGLVIDGGNMEARDGVSKRRVE